MQNIEFVFHILERLEKKIDSVIQSQTDHKVILTTHANYLEEYNQQLKEHIHRTNLLEQRIAPLEKDLEIRRIKQSFIATHWKRISAVVGIAATLIGTAWYCVQLFFRLINKP